MRGKRITTGSTPSPHELDYLLEDQSSEDLLTHIAINNDDDQTEEKKDAVCICPPNTWVYKRNAHFPVTMFCIIATSSTISWAIVEAFTKVSPTFRAALLGTALASSAALGLTLFFGTEKSKKEESTVPELTSLNSESEEINSLAPSVLR